MVCVCAWLIDYSLFIISIHHRPTIAQVLVKRDELTLEGIKQFFVAVEKEEWKFDTLCDLYDTLTITQVRLPASRQTAFIALCTAESHCSPINWNLRLAGGDLLQHAQEGGLAAEQDGGGQLHGVGHAWGHAAEGARGHHGGVPVSTAPCLCVCLPTDRRPDGLTD